MKNADRILTSGGKHRHEEIVGLPPNATGVATQKLVHELEVHQIELEMQNVELRQARDEVESALRRFTDLYDFAPVGYFTLDSGGVIHSVNLRGASQVGLECSQLIKRQFGLLVSAAARPLFSDFLQKVFDRQGKEICEVPLTTKGDLPVFVHIEADALGDGQECRVAVVDISARKHAEKLLHEYEELNRKTLQALPAHIAVIDRQGRIVAVNHAWTEFARNNEAASSPMVAVGTNYCGICRRAVQNGDVDAAKALAGIEAVMDGRHERFTLEYPCHSRQQDRWFLMTVVPLDAGGVGGAVITHTNITVRKVAEENLQKAYDEMEAKVQERTSELSKAFSEIKLLKDRLQAENSYLQREVAQQFNYGEIVGHSDVLSQVFTQIEQVAPMNATVLLLGETGTGKGVVARAIYRSSARKERPLITVNCATLPSTLVESELFGREKGAFTGAYERQIGRFELANGGTIFLDEIGEMPMELQCKLLRVIQDGEFERLGSSRTITTDVRIIAATNRNLEQEIRDGRFREDLFYRLNVFPITMPPLRQHREDIPLLVNHFVDKFNKKIGKNILSVPKDTMNYLQQYDWPGNVRELESVIERSIITSQGTVLQLLDRFDTFRKTSEPEGRGTVPLADLEHDHILQVLKKTGWRIEGKNGAAGILGLNASTLRARMRKYGVVRD
jgi:formate hydrogenlyase transcriptional activator